MATKTRENYSLFMLYSLPNMKILLRKCFFPSWIRFVSNYSAKLCWKFEINILEFDKISKNLMKIVQISFKFYKLYCKFSQYNFKLLN